jgi:2-keto-4-pentenoate hydratase/2-oxohepta-3-ene-1,7-dioic acid hydratase in catechol pathway
MKLTSYHHHGEARVGIVIDTHIVDVRAVHPDAPTTMRQFLRWFADQPDPDTLETGAVERAAAGESVSLADVRLLPVVPDPHAVWCAALTYLSHVREGGSRPVPEYPLFFLRVANSQVGHCEDLILPAASRELDYEGELAVVIGRAGRHIPVDRAAEHIAGYSCYNEGSVRDWQRHTSQITPGKNFAASGSFGPWLVTADEFGDPYKHLLTTRVNGEIRQSASISELLFEIEYMIHYLSTICTLEVGDVIVTGTPGGVGLRRDPPTFLVPGDVVEVEVDGIGTLRNTVAPEIDPSVAANATLR